MKTELLKTLWMLRFEKIRQGEEDAAWKYQELLDLYLEETGKSEVTTLLAQLVKEERQHENMAMNLIRVCHNTHPEIGVSMP